MKKNYIFSKISSLSIIFWCFSLLIGFDGNAQNLNFTIDTAIDNGTSITEVISIGADTYELTVFHSGNEELDNLGGGDLVFFLSAIDPLTPYLLSIKKNGELVNFKLNSIDYDTLGAGVISVTNQDDQEISPPTFYALGSGSLVITNTGNAFDITGIKIFPTDADDLNDFGFHNINVDILDTLGVDENSLLSNHVVIFPNPSNGNIFIKNSLVSLQQIRISDLNGKQLLAYEFDRYIGSQELHLNSVLASGVYLISIASENALVTKKLIIN